MGGTRVLKTLGLMAGQTEGLPSVACALPAESEEPVVHCDHSYVEVGLLQIHDGYSLMWMQESSDGLQGLHLERGMQL